MASKTTKSIPFIVLFIVGGMMAVDMFTEFEITQIHIDFIGYLLVTMGLGGIYKTVPTKAFEMYKKLKEK